MNLYHENPIKSHDFPTKNGDFPPWTSPFFFTEVPAQKAQPKPSRPAQKQTPKTRRHRCEDVRSSRLRVEICCFMIYDINMTSIYDIDIWHQYEIYEICWFMTSTWLESVIAVTEKRLDFGCYFGQSFFWLGVTATGIDSKYLKILQYEI